MLEVDGAALSYDGAEALHRASCRVSPGETIALAGANGSGKSTLVRLMCAMALPDSGSVLVDGVDPSSGSRERLQVRAAVGLVQQDPRDQIVSTTVFDEVAFGPRNLGLGEREVDLRVTASLEAAGLEGFRGRDTNALSGGEQARLALAGVLAMEPSYLLLDEVSSQLDSSARPRFRRLVHGLVRERGVGSVLVTHDPFEALACDRLIVMGDGRIVYEGSPWGLLADEGSGLGWPDVFIDDPYVDVMGAALREGLDPRGGVTPGRLASWLGDHPDAHARALRAIENAVPRKSAHRLEDGGIDCSGVSFSYGARRVLDSVDLHVPRGSVTLLAGVSGSGKSTLGMLIAGLVAPDAGSVRVCGLPASPGACGIAFQRPEEQLFLDTVAEELAFAPRNLGRGEDQVRALVKRSCELAGIPDDMLDRYPFALSGGQARRVGCGSVITSGAGAYVFDEPTAGLDACGRRHLHGLVRTLADEGAAVLVTSHDLGEWLPVADRVGLMADGSIAWSGNSRDLVRDPSPFARARLLAPEWVELVRALEREGAAS